MKQIYENNRTVETTYPQTKLIIRAKKQSKNNLWTIVVCDIENNKEKEITQNAPKTALKILFSACLNSNIKFSDES